MTINGENFKNLSIIQLENYIVEMEDEIEKRKKMSCQYEHEILYKAIIAFQKTGYKSFLSDGQTIINIADIKQIYNTDFDCGYRFALGYEPVEEYK